MKPLPSFRLQYQLSSLHFIVPFVLLLENEISELRVQIQTKRNLFPDNKLLVVFWNCFSSNKLQIQDLRKFPNFITLLWEILCGGDNP